MENRLFNKLGISSSILGFGCMRFPLNQEGTIDEVESQKMIDKAMENGVNYIDTAFPYHEGASEPFVGRALKKYKREDYLLATKLPIWKINSRDHAREVFEDQLKRLDVEYVDFYLLHALDQEKWDTILKFDLLSLVDEFKAEGKIKYLGFSFHDEFPVFDTIVNYRPWDFCQLQLNYMDMDIQAGLKGLQMAEQLEIPVIVMEPIKGGSLASLPEDVTKILKDYNADASLSSWALRYTATLPNVKVILSGMSTMEHVEDNLATFTDYKDLNNDELALISTVVEILKSRTQNGCTGCGYCVPCPVGINIPNCFRYWNSGHIYGDHLGFTNKLKAMGDSGPAKCVKCGKCERMCPQQIKIIKDLEKVTEYMNK